MSLSIIRKFLGLYDTWNWQAGQQGVDSLVPCILPQTSTPIRFTTREIVIEDQSGLARFIEGVPKAKMQWVADPEPNDDPILYCPEIDFTTQLFVAVVSHEPNRFIELDIEGVKWVSGTMRVTCHYQPGPVQAKVISFGRYCAVILERRN